MPKASNSEQMAKLTPWASLNKVQHRRTITGIANRYLVLSLRMCGASMSASLNAAALLILKCWTHLSSPYCSMTNRVNHAVECGFTQKPISS